jgi:hypothetical protein
MKVRELIEWLETFDPEAEVHKSYNTNNYWGDVVAPQVTEVFQGEVEWSEYHRTTKLITEDNDEPAQTTGRRVIVIS